MTRDNCPICYLPRYRFNLASGKTIRSTFCLKHHRAKQRHGHPLGRNIPRRLWDRDKRRPGASSFFRDARRFLKAHWHTDETREAVRTIREILNPETVSRRDYPKLVVALERLRNPPVVTPRKALAVVLAMHFLLDAHPELLPKTATGEVKWVAIARALVRLKKLPIQNIRWIDTVTPKGTRRSTPKVTWTTPPALKAMRLLAGRLEKLSGYLAFVKEHAEATLSTPLVESEYLPPPEPDEDTDLDPWKLPPKKP